MRVVALTELKGEIEAEAPVLAAMLGLSPYDVRTRVAGAPPKILVQTADEAIARRIQRDIAARGHGVVVCDASSVVPASQMVRLHRFHIDPSGVWANGLSGERLSWSDLGVVVVATVRTPVARTTEEVEYQMPRQSTPSKVTRHVTRSEQVASNIAYLFPNSRAVGQRPWLLEEASAQFLTLGREMQATRHANFFATIAILRRLAPEAVVDDRFVTSPLTSHGTVYVRGNETAPPPTAAAIVDLTVSILAGWLQRDRRGPYR